VLVLVLLGHSSEMKHVMSVSRECMVWLCHREMAHCVMGTVLLGQCGGIGHVMSICRECMVWWCHDRVGTRGVSWLHTCLHAPCEGPTGGLPQKGLLCQRQALVLMSGYGLAVSGLAPVGCPFPLCAVVCLV
jgi:hypothetical protein